MKYIALLMLPLVAASCSSRHTLEVSNDSPIARDGELAQVPLSQIREAVGEGSFVITDASEAEVPYQITFDSLVVFPAKVAANSKAVYTIAAGTPAPVDTVVCGDFYPRRKDDLTWENEKAAYRAYGPALQATGERAFGYDVWTKSVTHPVVAKRYRDAFAKIANFHEDHGEGMDVYTVGPTLGAGTAALLDSAGVITYPWCFESYEILDNGPLRFTVRLTYPAGAFGNDSTVRETRLISLDSGEFLNRAEVRYEGLSREATVAPGIVLHRHNPDGYILDNENSFMACADLTDNPDGQNGVIYVGVVAPQADTIVLSPMPQAEGDAVAHLLAKGAYQPGTPYVYYWGSGWSKGFMPDWDSWTDYLAAFRQRVEHPLSVEVK
ncbi:MAG: DUF4861 domain-containing protein [[Clostridium] fimetarium]|nr:DUF4861 domain-containing protein [Alistipes timonensis]MCM1405600.1 DUF4861 domain-containing protein [[Clostridium] fimetarium]